MKKLIRDNRGASLIIVIAIFALVMVLCLNILMAANVTSNNLANEYESDKIDLYISSVYRTINSQICEGNFGNVFDGIQSDGIESNSITFTGYKYGGKSVDVTAECVKNGPGYGTIYYRFLLNNKEYEVIGSYSVSRVGGGVLITSTGCSGIEY